MLCFRDSAARYLIAVRNESEMDIFSGLIGFLIGAVTGATGHYLAEKFTDERRLKELRRQEDIQWKKLISRFPKVLTEMQEDATSENNNGIREFFVTKERLTIIRSEPYFAYCPVKHPDLKAAVAHMQELGYVVDITPGNTPMYRMTEDFVDRLKNS